MDKLVDKGILSVQEANELKKESDAGFKKSYQTKSGLPDWVTSLKLGGDFRGRYESFQSPNDAFVDRNRFRYRLRVGTVATLKDNFEVGMRLTSGEATGTSGGDPISGNATFQENGSKKFVWLDLAYAKWTFLNNKELTSAVTIGKMENPFVFSDMVFDADYTPEGIGYGMTYRLNDAHSLKFNGGAFALDEIGGSHEDPWLYGGQVRWDATWSKPLASTIGFAALNLVKSQSLGNAAVPNIQRGNTRDAAGNLVNHYNPLVADAAITYTLDEFPGYKGAYPIKVAGEYANNPAVSDRESAFSGGLTLGKAGKKGTWEVGYRYKYLGGDFWYEEFVDSDFGAFYEGAFPNSGTAAATYGAGTNTRGHVMKASYSPYDSLTLTATAYLTRLINEFPASSDSRMFRLQVDAMWRF